MISIKPLFNLQILVFSVLFVISYAEINAANIFTHYIKSDLEAAEMTVRPAEFFGKAINGIEVICRLKAAGSFLRRYGDYCAEGQDLDFLIEASLKDDARGDPMINQETLEMLNIINIPEYKKIKALTKQITAIIRDDLFNKGLTLYDIKIEFGKIDGKIALIDEISSGCMRVYKNNTWLQGLELNKYFI